MSDMSRDDDKGAQTRGVTVRRDDGATHQFGAGCVVCITCGSVADHGRQQRLRQGTFRIGTAPVCDLVLHDDLVSREHVELAVTPGGISVRDLGSTNGSFYLGQRIEKVALVHGGQIELGATTIAILPGGTLDEAEPAMRDHYGALLGASVPMRHLYALLERLENSEVSTLIVGETGTGKEVVARAIHLHSPRRQRPLVTVDCGSIPRNLIESELFGHVRGAFSGAVEDRQGVFEQANGGTLFLDEVGELPLEMQPKLLRALETGEVKRVGDNRMRQVSLRVIAATHRDLEPMVRTGAFREDLYYRLAVVTIQVPPLRHRIDDIPLLAAAFVRNLHPHGEAGALPPAFVGTMANYDWPGNVRELRNVVQRVGALGAAHSPALAGRPRRDASEDVSLPYKQARERMLEQFERSYVEAVLREHGGNISGAARASGIARGYFRQLLKKHGLYDK